MDKKLKIILIGITMLCLTSLTVSAASLIKSSDVVYDNTASGLKSTTVQGAVDELYSVATDYSDLSLEISELKTTVNTLTTNSFLNAHPVGSIYLTISENENTVTKMHDLYGGTWESYGQGRTLVGVGTGTDSNGTVKVFNKNESAGEYNHTLTVSEMPRHKHVVHPGGNGGWFYTNGHEIGGIFRDVDLYAELSMTIKSGPANIRIEVTDNVGDNNSHNNIQPYTTVYMYKRIN